MSFRGTRSSGWPSHKKSRRKCHSQDLAAGTGRQLQWWMTEGDSAPDSLQKLGAGASPGMMALQMDPWMGQLQILPGGVGPPNLPKGSLRRWPLF